MQKTNYYLEIVSIQKQLNVLYNAFYPSEILVFRSYEMINVLGFIVCIFDL